MSETKTLQKTIDAYYKGDSDRRLKRPYNNPYNKNKEKKEYKAYKNGYKD